MATNLSPRWLFPSLSWACHPGSGNPHEAYWLSYKFAKADVNYNVHCASEWTDSSEQKTVTKGLFFWVKIKTLLWRSCPHLPSAGVAAVQVSVVLGIQSRVSKSDTETHSINWVTSPAPKSFQSFNRFPELSSTLMQMHCTGSLTTSTWDMSAKQLIMKRLTMWSSLHHHISCACVHKSVCACGGLRLVSGISLDSPGLPYIPGIRVGSADPNSDLHACSARFLRAKPFLQPTWPMFYQSHGPPPSHKCLLPRRQGEHFSARRLSSVVSFLTFYFISLFLQWIGEVWLCEKRCLKYFAKISSQLAL